MGPVHAPEFKKSQLAARSREEVGEDKQKIKKGKFSEVKDRGGEVIHQRHKRQCKFLKGFPAYRQRSYWVRIIPLHF